MGNAGPVALFAAYQGEDITMQIRSDGAMGLMTLATQTYFSISANGQALEEISDYNMTQTQSIEQDLLYYSILTPIASALEDSNKIAYIKSQLGIPEDLPTEDMIDIDDLTYWEAGDRYLVYCAFYYRGALIAAASVDWETGELVRDIMPYGG